MRELAVGDIHGCARAFQTLLTAFNPQSTDTIVLLGDYIDRGPGSCEVLDMILALNSECTVVALAGNHEKMLLQSRTDAGVYAEWLTHGGRATLDSYRRRGFSGELDSIPERHWKFFLEATLDFWETDERIFVHASLDPELDMPEQPEYLLFWQTFIDPTRHKSGKPIVCGHTSQKSGWPALFNGGICIDTWAYGNGWLTCLDTTHGTFLQTNEEGELRSFSIQDLRE